LHALDEFASARLRDRAEVTDELLLGHANALVGDVEDAVLRICLDADIQICQITRAEGLLVSQANETNLVKGLDRTK
jgi:hypothetical protein